MTQLTKTGIACGFLMTTASLAQAGVTSLTVESTNSWSSGHSGQISFVNSGVDPIEGWSFWIEDGPAITSAWNCEWSADGNRDSFLDAGWNGIIDPGETVTIGYEATGLLEQTITGAEFNGMPVEINYAGADEGDGDDDGSDGGNDGDDGGNDGGGGDDTGDGSGTTPGCDGDTDGNGAVDVSDILAVLDGWGPCPGCGADVDGNDVVDVDDMLAVLGAWGDCPSTGPTNKRIVGYYIEWGIYGRDYQPADMPLDKITHVNYAFANIGDDGRIAIGDPYAAIERSYPGDTWDQPYRGTYNQLNNVLKPQYPHLKTLISVGGWTWSGKFSDVAQTAQSRQIFAESCVEFIRTYNFDGVDIDWEYPVCCGLSSNTYRPEDRENYTLLAEELRNQLDAAGQEDGREYLLTIAAAGGIDKLENYELAELASHLDWVNTMSYDFMGSWDLSITGHHSGLYANPDNPSPNQNVRNFYNAHHSVLPWLEAGVEPDKIVMGVPFYGRAWGGVNPTNNGLFQAGTLVPPGTWDDWSSGATGMNDYTEIASFIASGNYVRLWDDTAKVPWAWSPDNHGGHFISYDDAESIELKMDYIKDNSLGGVMFWEVTADREAELLDVMYQSLEVE